MTAQTPDAPGHTPGPWFYRPCEHDDWGIVRAAPTDGWLGYIICQARNPEVSNEDLWAYREQKRDPYAANARLIAAAPELLSLVRDALEIIDDQLPGEFPAFTTDARAAITRATSTIADGRVG